MSTRPTFFQTPTVEIDQDRYEELIKNEMKYEQYKQLADEETKSIIETKIDMTIEIKNNNESEEN